MKSLGRPARATLPSYVVMGPHAYPGQRAQQQRENRHERGAGPVSLADKDYLPLSPMG
jgi:hypothetical protein